MGGSEMTKDNPLVSICIPTYNRGVYLENTIKSIIKQDVFCNTNDIELVICDNCSTDNTQKIVKKYSDTFPDKIVYVRNKKTVHSSKNFYKVLMLASGRFVKLSNDTVMYKEGGIAELLKIVRINLRSKSILFF